MRELTLHEKITLKGKLAFSGVAPCHLLDLTMRSAVHFWYQCSYKPICDYAKFREVSR